MLSKSSIYAIRSVIYIGHNSFNDKKITGIKEIASELELPSFYLSKLLQTLSKRKLIGSIKGPNGGFYFNENSNELTILQIIDAIDGISAFIDCGLGLKECSEKHPCPIHDDFKVYRDGLFRLFRDKKIVDLVTKIEEGRAFIRNLSKLEC
ncbi:MAG: Rrf2 family transcriptional regulator [Flavobacteriales bacterium]|nr:Rrf2 family transcriptional regulator [Flavobacteriales bacterium]